jgi:hypothetical protein
MKISYSFSCTLFTTHLYLYNRYPFRAPVPICSDEQINQSLKAGIDTLKLDSLNDVMIF